VSELPVVGRFMMPKTPALDGPTDPALDSQTDPALDSQTNQTKELVS
jgi:hypothetical protein